MSIISNKYYNGYLKDNINKLIIIKLIIGKVKFFIIVIIK